MLIAAQQSVSAIVDIDCRTETMMKLWTSSDNNNTSLLLILLQILLQIAQLQLTLLLLTVLEHVNISNKCTCCSVYHLESKWTSSAVRIMCGLFLPIYGTRYSLTHSLTAAHNRLWVVAPSMLTGHQEEPMRQQQWVRCPARSDSSM